MKLYFITQESLDYLKANIPYHLNYYSEPTNEWIQDVCGENPFREFRGDYSEFRMITDTPSVQQSDYLNVTSLYSSLSDLSASIATDERLWAGMALKQFWSYVKYRWIPGTPSIKLIESHYYFGYGGRRSLLRNALSRLWWIGKLSVDPSRENKFELTDILCEASSFIVDILERNFSSNPKITRGILTAMKQLRDEGITVTRDVVRDLATHLTLIGGIYILDLFSEEEIATRLYQYGKTKYGSA